VSIPTTLEVEDELRAAVAGTTVLDHTASWQEQLAATADALGVPERATALQERLDGDLADLAADLAGAGLGGATASVLGELDGVFSPPAATPAGTVLAGAGLTRPAPQQQATTAGSPFVPVSPETLGEHAADVVHLLTGGPYGGAAGITGSPLWPPVEAGARAGVHPVSAETGFGSSAFTVDWIARDLRATLLDGGSAATDAEAPERFRAFTAG
jgi:ABC-type Fe3+-hydroxamate transport system substrate-binding protein